MRAKLYQDLNGDKILSPLKLYVPGQVYTDGWAVSVTLPEIMDAAGGVDGMAFYVEHNNIII